ncbi:hypothetical protein Bbelb_170040 [Branchiostoma belcheri]|nr:hypothetical protein Bbelb_170040 [Branchiostoma belcheri]
MPITCRSRADHVQGLGDFVNIRPDGNSHDTVRDRVTDNISRPANTGLIEERSILLYVLATIELSRTPITDGGQGRVEKKNPLFPVMTSLMSTFKLCNDEQSIELAMAGCF